MTTIKKMRVAILSIAIGVTSSATAHAQDHSNHKTTKGVKVDAVSGESLATNDVKQDHDNSKAPHGGKIEEAGEYHIEASIKDSKVYYYLLDGNAKPMANKGVTGSVVLQFADGTTKTVQLTANGTDGFLADDVKAITYTNAIVTFKIADKTATAKFKNASEKKGHDHKEGDGHHH